MSSHLCCTVVTALFGLAALVSASEAADEKAEPAEEGLALFREQIRPILTNKCLTCHASDKKKGKLELTRRSLALAGGESGPALVPGNPDASLLYQKLLAVEMPPQNPLTARQITAFKHWIEAGAPFEGEPLVATARRAGPDWWSLQKIERRPPPVPRERSWVRTPIDAFILHKLEEHHLQPAPEADRATLIRRATFDLLGLPPTPEEIDRFARDPDPDAYQKLIERLLASPHYGERWGRHWLDVVRFAESHGYETNQLRPSAWPYRDYVIRSLNEDKPYPQFVLEQLAGDTLKGADWLDQSATGFLVGGAHDVVGNQTVEGQLQQRMDDLDDMITATGATFLGLTVNCARCHEHKFDPISQRDYYSLQAVFAGVQHTDRPILLPDAQRRQRDADQIAAELARLESRLDDFEPIANPDRQSPMRPAVNPKRNVDRFTPVEARLVRFSVLATNTQIEPCIDELEIYSAETTPRNVALASAGANATASSTLPNSRIHKLEHINDGRYGNERSWISNEQGKGWVQLELPQVTKIDRIVWGRDRNGKYTDRLATEYRMEVATEVSKWQVIATSADRVPLQATTKTANAPASSPGKMALLARRDQLQKLLAELDPKMLIYAGTFTQPGPTHLLARGDPMRKGDPVSAGTLSIVRPELTISQAATESERRLALARWICQPDNTLPARVMVNRVWHYHFGQGIVSTPSDFGYNGDRPSHPELLDWLASEYVRNGWQLKPLHRMIALSATYRQSSRVDQKAQAVDVQNRLLWRMTPRRLEAEAVRDAVLAVSGRLDRRMGGPGYNLWEKNTNYVVVFKPKEELGADEFRRMVYQFKPRSQQDPTFGIFDCPDAALAKPKRTVSTTALQALNLLNSSFLIGQADIFADRLRREAGEDPDRQVRRAFQIAFGRAPAKDEQTAAVALIRAQGVSAFCRAMYNANEFLYVD